MPVEGTWKSIIVPAALLKRIDRIAAEMLQGHIEGRGDLPNDVCQRVPRRYVLEVAIAELEAHRARSRASRRKVRNA